MCVVYPVIQIISTNACQSKYMDEQKKCCRYSIILIKKEQRHTMRWISIHTGQEIIRIKTSLSRISMMQLPPFKRIREVNTL